MSEADTPATEPGSPRRRPSRRAITIAISGAAVVLLALLAAVLPVPFIVVSPGPTFNTIGDVDGRPLVEISGTTTYPTTGYLDMTTVRERGEPRTSLTVFEALAAWADPEDAVLPREILYPDDVSGDEVAQRNAALFSTSQSHAVAAAMGVLERPVIEDVVVAAVVEGSPAQGALEPGDVIVSIDSAPVTTPAEVVEAVRARPVGSPLAFEVLRPGSASVDDTAAPVDVVVTSAASPDDPQLPYIGITAGILYRAEFPIEFTLTDVGGPSAGMMFALAIVDKLTPEDLAGGGHVAGTGTVSPEGAVGAIGGIRQKLAGARSAGATLFLMPELHCAEIAGYVPEGLTVVPVGTLADALAALAAWRAGEPTAACPDS